jgi:Flp pilus assembly protein TadG
MTSSMERGSISAFVVGLVMTIVTSGALVIDGGNVVREYLRFADLAENAARSGSQELRSLRSGEPTVDPVRAKYAAESFLALNGASGDVSVVDGEVVVTITAPVSFTLLRIIGLRGSNVTVTRVAVPVST